MAPLSDEPAPSVTRAPAPAVLNRLLGGVKPVLWTGGAILAGQALMAAVGIVSARLLGPSGKGIATAVLTWNQLLAWATVAGLSTAMAVSVAERVPDGNVEDEEVRLALGDALVFSLVAGGIVGLVAALSLPGLLEHLGPGAGTLAALAGATVPVGVAANAAYMIQLSLGRRRTYNLAQLANPVVLTVLTLFFVATVGLTPSRIVVSTLIGSVAGLLVGARGLPWGRLRVELSHLREELRFGSKIHLGSLCRLANLRLDYLAMSAFLPAVQIGLYSAANNALIVLATLPVAAATLITPRVASLGALPDASARQVELIRREAFRFTAIVAGVGAVIALLGPWGIPLVLGSDYRDTVPLVWILAPGYVLLTFNTIVAGGAAGMRRPWIATTSETVAIVATATLLPFLLPSLESRGAAITSTLAYAAAAVASAFGLSRLSRTPVGTARQQVAVAVSRTPATDASP